LNRTEILYFPSKSDRATKTAIVKTKYQYAYPLESPLWVKMDIFLVFQNLFKNEEGGFSDFWICYANHYFQYFMWYTQSPKNVRLVFKIELEYYSDQPFLKATQLILGNNNRRIVKKPMIRLRCMYQLNIFCQFYLQVPT